MLGAYLRGNRSTPSFHDAMEKHALKDEESKGSSQVLYTPRSAGAGD